MLPCCNISDLKHFSRCLAGDLRKRNELYVVCSAQTNKKPSKTEERSDFTVVSDL